MGQFIVRFPKRYFAFLLAILTIASTAPHARACQAFKAVGEPPYMAESYPVPLSLRINLRLLMKRELSARGMYTYQPGDQTFSDTLRTTIKKIQRERGEEATGCITWPLVQDLDSLNRTPPVESLR